MAKKQAQKPQAQQKAQPQKQVERKKKGVDIRALLKAHRDSWEEAEPMARGQLPVGDYQFELALPSTRDTAVVVDGDGAVRARILLRVVEGPEGSAGQATTKSYGLFDPEGEPDEMGLRILKTEMQALGIDVDDMTLEDVPDMVQSIIGSVVDADVRNKEDDQGAIRQNIYINGLARGAGSGTRRRRGGKA